MTFDADAWQPPRCSHDKIILGCPDDDCPEQNAYIEEMQAGLRAYNATLESNLRELLGVAPADSQVICWMQSEGCEPCEGIEGHGDPEW